jgi:drug/metabolite transporter (DMT)-like permease
VVAILLALTTSLLFGVANFLGPFFMRRWPQPTVMLTGQVAALALALVGLAASGEPAPPVDAIAWAALAGVGNAFGIIGFLEAVRYGPVSVVAPIGACGGAGPAIVGLAGGDPATAARLAGIALAIGGAVVVARRPTAASHGALERDDRSRCVAWALSSAVGFGLVLTVLPEATPDGRWWALCIIRVVIVSGIVALLTLRGVPLWLPRAPGALVQLGLPGYLLVTGTALYAIATERGDLSVVGVCATLYPLVTVALAVAVLGERASKVQLAGVCAATAGVALLAAG